MRRNKGLWTIAAGVMVVVLVGAACTKSSTTTESPTGATTAASPTEAPPVLVRISLADFGSQRFPVDVIEMKGLDKKYGITIERVPFTGPPANYLQITGDTADIAPATWLELQQNLARGLRLIGVGPLLRYTNPMVVAPDSDIQSPADLKGKRIGVYFLGGTDVQAVRAAIEQEYGFDFFKEATVQQADVPLLSTQLERGDLDAIFTFSNVGSQLVSEGKGRILFVAGDLLTDILGLTQDDPFGIYVTSANVINNFPERITGYLAAYKEAVQILLTDDEIWTELAKSQNITDPAGIAALRDTERQSFTTTWDQQTVEHMQQIFGILLDVGGTEVTGVDTFDASLYDTSFWE